MTTSLSSDRLSTSGNFSQGGKGYMDELKSYIIARLLKNPDYDVNLLINEFCYGYYEDAAPFIIDYINLWENNIKNYELWLYDDSDHPLFSDNLIDKPTLIYDIVR